MREGSKEEKEGQRFDDCSLLAMNRDRSYGRRRTVSVLLPSTRTKNAAQG